ncbi:MAG: single-stranded DNA-binding protein [Chloroflexi bacterium]|nr:single-stranded DNA-binding protein [Chloroflexota bacterium]
MRDGRRIVLAGRLMDEPRLRRSGPGGAPFLRMRLTVTRHGKEERAATGSVPLVETSVRGRLAEICAGSLKKGQSVAVAGSLRAIRSKAAAGTSRSRLEVSADRVQILKGEHANTSDARTRSVERDQLPRQVALKCCRLRDVVRI